jgi:hypothetical protein
MTPHPAIAQLRLVIALASRPATDPARLRAVPGVQVRARNGVLELATIALDGDGPTLAELEAALGPSRELPRLPGPPFAIVAFNRTGRLALFAHVDDVTGRAVELLVRRDY